jgi:hypothetical protein
MTAMRERRGEGRLRVVPLTQRQAAGFVAEHHRHHDPLTIDKYRIGAALGDRLVGVAQVARPVAHALDDGATLEVARLCTDGTPNACSFLYSAAARVARDLGYARIITYILASEDGTSLKAAGWRKEADVRGHDWSHPSRPRACTAPTCDKQRWSRQWR